METRYAINRAAADNAAQHEQNIATYKDWLARHPEVQDCIANLTMFAGYMDFTDLLSDSDFDFALSNLKDHLALQRVPTPQEVVDAENKHRRKLSVPQLHELARKEHPAPTRGVLPSEWFGV